MRQVPAALSQDAVTDADKLIVVNYWRGLSSSEQSKAFQDPKVVYKRPTTSNSLLWGRRSRSLYIGSTGSDEMLESNAVESNIAPRAKLAKRRKVSVPAATNSQMLIRPFSDWRHQNS